MNGGPDMATYLYGLILARNAPLVRPGVAGIGGGAMRVAPCGKLDALVSTMDAGPDRGSLDQVRAHDSALQAVVRQGVTVAATRFGQSFTDDDALCRFVRERGDRIVRVLEESDGCVEMRVLAPGLAPARPADPMDDASEAGPGRAYLERLRAAANPARPPDLFLRPALGPVVRAERVEALPDAHGVAFAHLVERGREAEYRGAVASLAALQGARIVGPLPLYSFAEPAGGTEVGGAGSGDMSDAGGRGSGTQETGSE